MRKEARLPLIPGRDLSGVVVSVGSGVPYLRPGDEVGPLPRALGREEALFEVFGAVGVSRQGSFAQYANVNCFSAIDRPSW